MPRLALAAIFFALFCSASYLVYQVLKAQEHENLAALEHVPPALHVVGVYEAGGTKRRRAKTKEDECLDDAIAKAGVITSPEDLDIGAMLKCKRQSGDRPEGEVDVEVTDTTRPVVLAFSSYEPTLWKVSLARGVVIKKVILSGYYAQRIRGIDDETPVAIYTHASSEPCRQCTQNSSYFYSYESPPAELKKIAAIEPTSFQGSYRGERFSISELTALPGK